MKGMFESGTFFRGKDRIRLAVISTGTGGGSPEGGFFVEKASPGGVNCSMANTVPFRQG